MVELKFHCCMPIFIARQWIRHRTANVNEYSGRYSLIPMLFYTPAGRAAADPEPAQQPGAQRPGAAAATWAARPSGAGTRSRRLARRHLRVADRQRRGPRAGAHRSAAVDLHPVVLEDRPAQPAALPDPARGPPRAVGDPGVRAGDGRHAQAGGAAVLRGLDRLRRVRRARCRAWSWTCCARWSRRRRGRRADRAGGRAGPRRRCWPPAWPRARSTSCWPSCTPAAGARLRAGRQPAPARPNTSPNASPRPSPGRPGPAPRPATANSLAAAACRLPERG